MISKAIIRPTAILLPVLILCHPVSAGQSITCGAASVEFGVEAVPGQDGVFTVVTFRNGDRTNTVRHEAVDYVGAKCVVDSADRKLILYQAYCGGSSCRDLDNYGIVDPDTLTVEISPSDGNRPDVAARLGREPPRVSPMISVSKLADTHGKLP